MRHIIRAALSLWVLTFASGVMAQQQTPKIETAIFAGGCFWCVEADFEKLPGVVDAESGYTGGQLENPTYEQVSQGGTGHAESVRLHYDPAKVTYTQLLDYFWHHIDPTAKDQQFCDHGNQYRSAIFYLNESQRLAAQASKAELRPAASLAENGSLC